MPISIAEATITIQIAIHETHLTYSVNSRPTTDNTKEKNQSHCIQITTKAKLNPKIYNTTSKGTIIPDTIKKSEHLQNKQILEYKFSDTYIAPIDIMSPKS